MLSLNFSPFPVLKTERLLLRSIVPGDAPELFFLRTDVQVLRFLDRDPMGSLDETNTFIEKILDSQHKNESILWVICLKEDPGTMIGTVGYWRVTKEHYRAEIGYLLHPRFWNKGIMKEAVKAAVQYAFTQTEIHSIEANINPANAPSASLLKSCGFEQEAYFKENYYYNGSFGDSMIFSLINGRV